MKFEKICVLGLGYIGLPVASTFAVHGINVIGVDVNQRVVSILQNGDIHIHEPGLRTVVQAAFRSGNLSVCDKPTEADGFIIAVPTPFCDDKSADLSYVIAAAEAIVPYLRPGNLVMLESTSPPKTTVNVVAPILERSGLKAGTDFYLAYTPERVLPGQILQELIENARVIGGVDQASAEAGRDLYALFVRGEIILTDATTAEMVKLMENTYRDINIAIAIEFSRLAERFGVDGWEAIKLANRHPRVNILRPGPGVGGHCIRVDPWFLVEAAPDLTPLILTARQVNDSQPRHVANLIMSALEGLPEKRVALLGLTYKPDVDDLRESPAIETARILVDLGCQVYAYDPINSSAQVSGVTTVPTLKEALSEADVFVLMVMHTALKELEPSMVASLTRTRIGVDAVDGWQREAWEASGFHIIRLGDGKKILGREPKNQIEG
jgi:UDP-N-acetyl-D-mannosaminuronic acid dehydrogenase